MSVFPSKARKVGLVYGRRFKTKTTYRSSRPTLVPFFSRCAELVRRLTGPAVKSRKHFHLISEIRKKFPQRWHYCIKISGCAFRGFDLWMFTAHLKIRYNPTLRRYTSQIHTKRKVTPPPPPHPTVACIGTFPVLLSLLLLLLSSSSSSYTLCRVFILIFLRQTMSLGNTVLQLFCCYSSWCLYR